MAEKESECEGCRSYEGYCKFGIIQNIAKTNGCPCRTCLVKGICNDLCDDFMDYKLLSRSIKNFDAVLREFNQRGKTYYGTYNRKILIEKEK